MRGVARGPALDLDFFQQAVEAEVSDLTKPNS
jgi:hypothetical protein